VHVLGASPSAAHVNSAPSSEELNLAVAVLPAAAAVTVTCGATVSTVKERCAFSAPDRTSKRWLPSGSACAV
jgi:hypothetical protein